MSDLKQTPWKNGGGITREIAERRSDGALVWRLSMADVASDGPFSNFAGLTRVLTVIEGNGMELISPECSLSALYGQPVRFDGALDVASRLRDGPLRDLNLMFDPLLCDGDVTPVAGPHQRVLQAGPDLTYGVHCLEGAIDLDGTDQLPPGDTALIDAGSVEMQLAEGAFALLITLTVQDHSQK
jgi:hypothetical protein